MRWHETLGGRKFIAVMSGLLSVTGLTWGEKIDGGVYGFVVVGTLGAYITGNVLQKKNEAEAQEQP